jgi:RNA polymerase sigma factor for flagellar operon FliA
MNRSQNLFKLIEEIVNKEEQEKLVLDTMSLVKYIANSMAYKLPSYVSKNDLISAGMLGLLDAARKFDPSRGFMFKTYAEPKIRGAIADELRNMDIVSRGLRKDIKGHEKVIQNLRNKFGRDPDDE